MVCVCVCLLFIFNSVCLKNCTALIPKDLGKQKEKVVICYTSGIMAVVFISRLFFKSLNWPGVLTLSDLWFWFFFLQMLQPQFKPHNIQQVLLRLFQVTFTRLKPDPSQSSDLSQV